MRINATQVGSHQGSPRSLLQCIVQGLVDGELCTRLSSDLVTMEFV
jgi:hypothetical protein